MRRKDREIKDFQEIISIINQCEIIRLAMVDQGLPYIVPLNFGYSLDQDTLTLYMHSASTGRKIDILKQQPIVCFEMDRPFQITKDEIPCNWTYEQESIIGNGTVVFLDDIEEKKVAMHAIMKHYGYEGTPTYTPDVLEHTCLYKIIVEDISGKRNIKHQG